MAKLPKQCPSCNAMLVVSRLTCPQCGTEVTGNYPLDLFARLGPNDFDFVVLFLKTKGNVKEMERELGISYWTIRSKLTEIVRQLGLEPSEEAEPQPGAPAEDGRAAAAGDLSARRQEILEQLNAGHLTAQEAAAQLARLKPGANRGRV